jgi:hypothetical protein
MAHRSLALPVPKVPAKPVALGTRPCAPQPRERSGHKSAATAHLDRQRQAMLMCCTPDTYLGRYHTDRHPGARQNTAICPAGPPARSQRRSTGESNVAANCTCICTASAPRTSPPSSSATARTGKPAALSERPHDNCRLWGARGPRGDGHHGPPGPRGRRLGTSARPTPTASAPRPRAVLNRHRREPRFRYTPGGPATPPAGRGV